jgi:hypothetical protein
MNKKQIKEEVDTRLARGESKAVTLRQLSGQGVSDRIVANFIASYASPDLCSRHARLVKSMVVISWVQFALAVPVSISIALGLKAGFALGLLVIAFMCAFAYLFVWGFTNNRAWAYNATIIFSFLNFSNSFKDFAAKPIATTIGLAVGLALVSFAFYVRNKIFPDFAFMGPKKLKGNYVFSS